LRQKAAFLQVVIGLLCCRSWSLPADLSEAGGGRGHSGDAAISIINRARRRLADLLHVDSLDDFGPEAQQRAVFTRDTVSIHQNVIEPKYSGLQQR
jgi:hypothetical protein